MVVATAVAATFSGIPSTLHALLTGRDPLAAVRAAGTLLPGLDRSRDTRPAMAGHVCREPGGGRALGGLVAGLVVHLVVSGFWGAMLARLPRRRPAAWGAGAGLGIAAVDQALIGRCSPAVRALPRLAQVADHIAFGALFGWTLGAGQTGLPQKAASGPVSCER